MKKFFTFLLALLMMATSVPALPVMASPPMMFAPVELIEASIPPTVGAPIPPPGQYNMRIAWLQRQAGLDGRGGVVSTPPNREPPNPPFPVNFHIYSIVGAARQRLGTVPGSEDFPDRFQFDVSRAFPNNNIVEIEVAPEHWVWQRRITGTHEDGTPIIDYVPIDGIPDPNIFPGQTNALLLTDIDVSAEMVDGESMRVAWSNPHLRGQRVFEGFDIYYAHIGNLNPDGSIPFDASRRISVPAVAGQTTMEHIFEIPEPQFGVPYFVKVEPTIGGHAVRTGAGPPPAHGINRVNVGGTEYLLAYSPVAREYRSTESVFLQPSLTYSRTDEYFIWLHWTVSGNPIRIEIFETAAYPPVFTDRDIIRTYHGMPMPSSTRVRPGDIPRTYMVRFTYLIDGEEFIVDSTMVVVTPTAGEFSVYRPNVIPLPHPPPDLPELTLLWEPFIRPPYDERELEIALQNPQWTLPGSPAHPMFLDRDVTYDVFVFDAPMEFDPRWSPLESIDALTLAAPRRGGDIDPRVTGADADRLFFSRAFFREYFHVTSTGVGGMGSAFDPTPRSIQRNSVYFVVMVARRVDVNGNEFLSRPAYAVVHIPPDDPLDIDPHMLISPPLQVSELNPRDFTISWPERFVEIYNPADRTWHAVLGRAPGGGIVYGREVLFDDRVEPIWITDELSTTDIDRIESGDPRGTEAVNEVLARHGLTQPGDYPFIARVINLRGLEYEIHTVDYNLMMQAINVPASPADNFHAYYLENLADAGAWRNIGSPPQDANGRFNFVVDVAENPAGGIFPNTAYTVYLRPFNPRTGARAFYPGYLVTTTPDERDPLVPTPTVPVLFPVEAGRDWLTVRWRLQGGEGAEGIQYNLHFSDRMTAYPQAGRPDTGIQSGWFSVPYDATAQNPHETATGVVWAEGGYAHFRIRGLFPETRYHIWIYARSEAETSGASNPIDMVTLGISPPGPPLSLGPASGFLINQFNRLSGTEYRADDPDAMIIQWSRAHDHRTAVRESRAQPDAGGANAQVVGGFNAAANRLEWAEPGDEYMLRFSDIVANRRYWVRARTIKTVTTTGDGAVWIYNYELHFSRDEEFMDYVAVTVPPVPALGQGDLRAYSDWVFSGPWMSGRTYDEYDGHPDPEHYPLPDQDWELIYDPPTDTLTFRFRSHLRGQRGEADQQADQRFISRLISQGVHTYRLPFDISRYRNRAVANAVIEIPYSILMAFHERRITMEASKDSLTLRFTPGSMATAEVRALNNPGREAYARITINSGQVEPLAAGSGYVSIPRRVGVQLRMPDRNRNITISNLAEPLGVEIGLAGQALQMQQNVGMYMQNANTGGWQRVAAEAPIGLDIMRFNARELGTFAAIGRLAPPGAMAGDPTADAFVRVNSAISITDMPSYHPNEPVSANALNNMIRAVAMGHTSVAIHQPLSAADAQSLARGRLLASGVGTVSRENAMAALVRLYELRTGRVVNPTAVNVPDLANVSAENRVAITKAAYLGFFVGNASPMMPMTMGDLITVVDIILLDS